MTGAELLEWLIGIAAGVLGVVWFIVSAFIAYHWFRFSRSTLMTLVVLTLYFGASLAILGRIAFTVSV